MPGSIAKKRMWSGLVCPVCRFIFRVPKNHDGNGVICPACNHLLNLPDSQQARRLPVSEIADEEEPATLLPEQKEKPESKPIVARPLNDGDQLPTAPVVAKSRQKIKDRKIRKSSTHSDPEWDQMGASVASDHKSSNAVYWIIGGTVLGLLTVVLAAKMILDQTSNNNKDRGLSHDSVLKPLPVGQERKVEMNEQEKKRDQEIKESVRAGRNVLISAEGVVKKFLNASSFEEAAKYVRSPEITMPRMREWYVREPWKAPGVRNVAVDGRVNVKGNMASMTVQKKDFSHRALTLEQVGDEFKVDWESWVVWSSMPWDEMFKKKPQQPVIVRVDASRDAYYNRHFSDDSQWFAVKLSHPDQDRVLYGYVKRDDLRFTRMIANLERNKNSLMTIKVKYLPESSADNQVQIVDYIRDGWVRLPSEDTVNEPMNSESSSGK